MALTKIKTGGIADNAITDAKVADAITVTGAQTGITQVGTLTAGVWNGTKVASAYLDDDTAHLSGSAFTGTISSSTGSTTDSALTLTDAGVADYKFTFPDTSTIRLSTSTSSDKILDITNAGSGAFGLRVEGEFEVKNGASRRISLNYEDSVNSIISHSGTSYGLEELNVRGDAIRFYTDYDSGTPKGNVTLTLDNSHNATFAGDVTIDTSSHSTLLIKGANNCDAEIALQSDNADDPTDQWSINAKHSTGGTLHFATYGSGAWTNPLILSHTSATFSGDVNVDGDAKRIYVRSATNELVSIGMAGSSGASLEQGYLRMKAVDGGSLTNKIALHTAGVSYFNGGNVGIGASPNALLDINKSTSSTDLPTGNESFEGYRLILANPQLTNNATNALGFSMYNGEVCAYIATQTHYNGEYETDLIFGTRDDDRDNGIDDTVGDGLKEAFRIDHDSNIQFHGNMFGGGSKDSAPWNDSSGNGVLYYQKGTSAFGATLALSTNVDVGGGYAGMYINLIGASASGDRMIAFSMDGSSAGQIHYSSSNQVAYATSGSDKRLKKNITNWTGNTLSKFANIEPKMFHWKTQDSSEDKIKGFIAQDMIENFPEAYPIGKMGEGDDQIERYQYNPSGMVIYLMKALKEQVAVNTDLTARIEALENA